MIGTISLLLSTALSVSEATSPELPVARALAAGHDGAREGARQVWRSHLVIDDPDLPAGRDLLLPLAVPLPEGVEVELKGGGPAALRRGAGGDAIGIIVPVDALGRRELVQRRWVRALHLVSSAPLRMGEDVRLSPPLPAGDAVQRVAFSAGDEHSFEPAAALEVVRHMTHLRTPEVSRELYHRCDRMLARGVELPNPTTMYLTAGPRLLDAGGLVGTLSSRAQQRQLVGIVIGVGGGLITLMLALTYRLLARVAARDQGQRHMQRRFEELQAELKAVDCALRELEPEEEAARAERA